MCGRFTSGAKPEQIEKEFKIERVNPKLFETPRYNIAPSQQIPAVLEFGGERRVEGVRWGLIPNWAKDESIGNKLINARAETLSEQPSFKNAFGSRRCIVPASGFYEWVRPAKSPKRLSNSNLLIRPAVPSAVF